MIKIHPLFEKTRRELLIKQKRETPQRILRAKQYSASNIVIDPNAILKNWMVLSTDISGNGKTYKVNIAFKSLISDIIEFASKDSSHIVNSKLIQKSLRYSLDTRDIYIDCNCPDFAFRYAYFATKDKFKWGKLQTSNGQKIRNPNNDIGCMCKHVYAILQSTSFLNHVSDKIMRTIIANVDVLYKTYKFNLEEFIVNANAYDRLLKANISRDSSGRFAKVNKEDTNDSKDESKDESEKENDINK